MRKVLGLVLVVVALAAMVGTVSANVSRPIEIFGGGVAQSQPVIWEP